MQPTSEPRALPHCKEAEAAVLGGVLLGGSQALADVLEITSAEDFYVPAFQAVMQAMSLIHEREQPVDIVSLESQLRRMGSLELVGGIEGLLRLDRHATAHNAKAHAKLVRESAQLRALAVAARDIYAAAMRDDCDPADLLARAETDVLAITGTQRRAGPRTAAEILVDVFADVTERQHSDDAVTGVSTGFHELDDMTAGFQAKDLIILAARPSHGKTALAMNVAANACVVHARYAANPEASPPRCPVLVFSLEMGAQQLMERLLCSEARVDSTMLRRGGRITEAGFRDLIAAAERVSKAQLSIDDSPALSITEIRGTARRWRSDRKLFPDSVSKPKGLIVLDYLQLARGSRKQYANRELEISEISRGLKAMAKELEVPVLALAQLNRKVDDRADHHPQLSDLRESGAIEQDADVIMFLFRAERYLNSDATEEERARVENRAEVIIAKQRTGAVGSLDLAFIARHTRFENPAREFDGP